MSGWDRSRVFLALAVTLTLGVIFLLINSRPTDGQSGTAGNTTQPAAPPAVKVAPTEKPPISLVGTWILTPEGGDDGQTTCDNFNASAIYRLNGQTARITAFENDGHYRSFFAYTTPSGDEHYTTYKAQWALEGSEVSLTDMSTRDAFRFDGGTDRWRVERLSQNAVKLGGERYVRCVGPASVFEGGDAAPDAKPAPNVTAAPNAEPTCKDLEDSLSELIVARTGRKVIEVNSYENKSAKGARACSAVAITDAGNLFIRFGLETTPKGKQVVEAIWSTSPFI